MDVVLVLLLLVMTALLLLGLVVTAVTWLVLWLRRETRLDQPARASVPPRPEQG